MIRVKGRALKRDIERGLFVWEAQQRVVVPTTESTFSERCTEKHTGKHLCKRYQPCKCSQPSKKGTCTVLSN